MTISKKYGTALKKIILLGFLLLALAAILSWQWLHREQPVPAVKDETEHRALAILRLFQHPLHPLKKKKSSSYHAQQHHQQRKGNRVLQVFPSFVFSLTFLRHFKRLHSNAKGFGQNWN